MGCTCQFYRTVTENQSHFATFPPAIPERCILAGTSEKGCCPACGTPWTRIVEKSRVPTRPAHISKTYVDPEGSPYEQHSGSVVGNRDPQRHISTSTTIGWKAGCECRPFADHLPAGEFSCEDGRAIPIPCTVLDPFLGSGTTLMVANALGRDGIGCELNPAYAEMARERIAGGWSPKKPKGKRRKRVKAQKELSFD